MTREERLKFCEICTLRKLDFNHGLLCSLTNKKADFEYECLSFNLDKNEQSDLAKKYNSINPVTKTESSSNKIVIEKNQNEDVKSLSIWGYWFFEGFFLINTLPFIFISFVMVSPYIGILSLILLLINLFSFAELISKEKEKPHLSFDNDFFKFRKSFHLFYFIFSITLSILFFCALIEFLFF